MLTEVEIKKAKPASKPYKLSDAHAMYLLVNPDGSRWWRLDYRFESKRLTISLGTYPDISLRVAREKREAARTEIKSGIDPSPKRKSDDVVDNDSFETIAREWLEKFRPQWVDSHAVRIVRRLERNRDYASLSQRPIKGLCR
jgi:hypothetical protein